MAINKLVLHIVNINFVLSGIKPVLELFLYFLTCFLQRYVYLCLPRVFTTRQWYLA